MVGEMAGNAIALAVSLLITLPASGCCHLTVKDEGGKSPPQYADADD
jgi:hypothetical protein